MKQIGLLRALALTRKANKMSNQERIALQQRRLKELIAYARKNSSYFSKLYKGIDKDCPLSE
ncbi:hypothetical protein, partial [Dubosiella newyorkensis]